MEAGDGTGIVIGGLATGGVGLVMAGTGMAMGTGLRCGGVAGAGVDALLAWPAAMGGALSGSSVANLACPLVPTVGEAVNGPGLYAVSLSSVG